MATHGRFIRCRASAALDIARCVRRVCGSRLSHLVIPIAATCYRLPVVSSRRCSLFYCLAVSPVRSIFCPSVRWFCYLCATPVLGQQNEAGSRHFETPRPHDASQTLSLTPCEPCAASANRRRYAPCDRANAPVGRRADAGRTLKSDNAICRGVKCDDEPNDTPSER